MSDTPVSKVQKSRDDIVSGESGTAGILRGHGSRALMKIYGGCIFNFWVVEFFLPLKFTHCSLSSRRKRHLFTQTHCILT